MDLINTTNIHQLASYIIEKKVILLICTVLVLLLEKNQCFVVKLIK